MPRHPFLRRALHLIAVLALAGAAACSLDEAELVRPGTAQVTADPGQLRVLSYDDLPGDRWLDVVRPDPEVFEEGDEFREQASRTAEDDEPAERRRLLTAVGPGRTLLVEVNCAWCDGNVPAGPDDVADIHVWDLVAGDAGARFSDGTAVARPGIARVLGVGEFLVTVRPGDEGPAERVVRGDEPAALRLVASHTPADGADLYVDVHVAVAQGETTLAYRADGSSTSYPVMVR